MEKRFLIVLGCVSFVNLNAMDINTKGGPENIVVEERLRERIRQVELEIKNKTSNEIWDEVCKKLGSSLEEIDPKNIVRAKEYAAQADAENKESMKEHLLELHNMLLKVRAYGCSPIKQEHISEWLEANQDLK